MKKSTKTMLFHFLFLENIFKIKEITAKLITVIESSLFK